MANIRLSVGFTSSSSIFSTQISFFKLVSHIFHRFNPSYLTKAKELVVDGSNRFLNCFLKRAANAHHFSYTLHTAAKDLADPGELFEIPTRDLNDDIIQGRFKARARDLCNRVLDLIKRNSETQLGCNKGQRIACRL